jgi:predicted NUDIX family NTP pyrophosphohydrolase
MDETNKPVCIWAFKGNCDIPDEVSSKLFELEWPAGSGCIEFYPEIDKINFFSVEDALTKIEPAQREFVLRLQRLMAIRMAISRTENYRAAI